MSKRSHHRAARPSRDRVARAPRVSRVLALLAASLADVQSDAAAAGYRI